VLRSETSSALAAEMRDAVVEAAVLLEALGAYGYDFAVPAVTSLTVAENLVKFGRTAQRERFLPRLLDGEICFSVGITEPVTGSDAASLATRAERDGDELDIPTGVATVPGGEELFVTNFGFEEMVGVAGDPSLSRLRL